MEIPFRFQFDSQHFAFTMTFEVQNIMGFYDGDVRSLYIQARIKREIYPGDQQQELYPVVLDMHGRLYRMNQSQENGAILQSSIDLPIVVRPGIPQSVNLSFAISAHYLQLLEEHRISQPMQDMVLQMQMRGVAAMVKPRDVDPPGVPYYLRSHSGELDHFEKISTDISDPQIRIERSAWIDRILPGLGYHHSLLIELPLVRTPPIPEVYQKAAEALDLARKAFDREDYRGAVKYGREVLEYLGNTSSDKKISTFCKEHLEPLVGETKSKAIDGSLNALRNITNAGSHANPFVADRAIASYLIETLALNLRYISLFIGGSL